MSDLDLKNFDIMIPDVICIQIVKEEAEEMVMYSADLVLVLDKLNNKILFLETDIVSETYLGAAQLALKHASRLFSCIADIAPVVDGKTGKLITEIDLSKSFSLTGALEDENDTSQYMAPDGVTIH